MASRGRKKVPHNLGAGRGSKINEGGRPFVSKGSAFPIEGAYKNKHLVHAITSLIGCIVELSKTNGDVYQGVLNAFSPQGEIAIDMATLCNDNHDLVRPLNKSSLTETLCVQWSDIIALSLIRNDNIKDIFKTDSEIGVRTNGLTTSRELQPFEFDESVDSVNEGMVGGGWNVEAMFDINEQKFNVSSSFNPEMSGYTTNLLLQDNEKDKQRLKEAERKAKEIEKGSLDSLQHGKIDDIGTEEELFSAVVIPSKERSQPELLVESAKEIKHNDTEQNESQSSPIEHGNETIEQTNTDTVVPTIPIIQTEPKVPSPVPSLQQQTDTNKSTFKLNPDAMEFRPLNDDTSPQSNVSPNLSHQGGTSSYPRIPRLKGPRGPRPSSYTDQQGLYGNYQPPSFQSGIRPLFHSPAGLTPTNQLPGHMTSPNNFVLRQPVNPLMGGQAQLYPIASTIGAPPMGQQQIYIPASQSAAIFAHPHQTLAQSLPQSPVVYLQAPMHGQNFGQSYLIPTQQLGGGTTPGSGNMVGYSHTQIGK